MGDTVQGLIERLRSPNYRVQATAARRLGELADISSEEALIDSFRGNTYRLIDQDGAPGRYYEIVSTAAQALAKLDTDRAFNELVSKVRENNKKDQLGVAATVYGLTFSRRPGVEDVIRSIRPWQGEDSAEHLAKEIGKALERARIEEYCKAQRFEIPVGFYRHAPGGQYAAIDMGSEPPKLVARRWSREEDVVSYLQNLPPEKRVRILDFKERVELVYQGETRFQRGNAF